MAHEFLAMRLQNFGNSCATRITTLVKPGVKRRPQREREANHSKSRAEIAYHEAGHAVIAWLTGHRILRVAINPRTGTEGCTTTDTIPAPDSLGPDQARTLLTREALIAVAGGLSCARFRGCTRSCGVSDEDLIKLRFSLLGSLDGGPEADRELTGIIERASFLIALHWQRIEALARALLRSGSLAEAEILTILRQPLLDARPRGIA